ncbi:hypothetical protein VTL71DRAFT_3962 [Oculimacula yallundae]|uniref:Transfer RNA methyltransferase 82 n=1 Tax=Oculimacula yallundae TaxID=86028 RepID=A0ABR4C4G4_9HELO
MSTQMPYQCMVTCGNVLVAARGSSIDSFNLEKGLFLSTWTCPISQENKNGKVPSTEIEIKEDTPNAVTPSEGGGPEDNGPPAKKRKLSSENVEAKIEETPTPKTNQRQQQPKKQKQNNRSDAVASGLQAPAVIALASTKDGRHVIAVTGEDKSIRVFESIEDGGSHKLVHISERAMPKRPCSVTISADDTTIISADKFGDVYSLPLLFTPTTSSQLTPSTPQTPEPTAAAKPFIPAANELTIHSQRNRKALENQKRQTNRPTEKIEPTFEHKLLLGHVSMLTDVALVAVEGRNYIVTADRDEHIRVSRGVPQAHIIEGFCLGHTEFITRLCFPSERTGVLISGGGEDELFVWEWLAGKIHSKANLKTYVDELRSKLAAFSGNDTPVEGSKIAVSGIYSTRAVVGSETQDVIIVTCEGVPALFTFTLTPKNQLEYMQTLQLSGNALSLVTSPFGILVSIDTVHTPGSTSEVRTESIETIQALESYVFQEGKLVSGGVTFVSAAGLGEVEAGAVGRLGNLLYGLENLRKREGDGDE